MLSAQASMASHGPLLRGQGGESQGGAVAKEGVREEGVKGVSRERGKEQGVAYRSPWALAAASHWSRADTDAQLSQPSKRASVCGGGARRGQGEGRSCGKEGESIRR